jgi:hypothetical protein
MTAKRLTRLDTAYALLDAYSTLSPEKMLEHLASDFTHQVLPESIGMPIRDRSAFAEHAAGITSIFSSFAIVPVNVFEDPERNTVIVHGKMVGQLNHDMGPWENECMMQLKMTEDQCKVLENKEFVDSAKAAKMKEKLAEMFGKQQANGIMLD